MTCPACNATLAPGAYCDGNGSHPPRRAKRLAGDERRAVQREAETRREGERTHAALVAVARPVVESAQQRRYLHRRGDLAGELAEAVKVGLIAWEDAARLEAETAAEVAAMDAERARRREEYEKTREIPAGFVAPFRYDGMHYIFDANNEMAADDRRRDGEGWGARGLGRISYLPDADATMTAWVEWVAEAVGNDDIDGEEVARRMNAKAGWVEGGGANVVKCSPATAWDLKPTGDGSPMAPTATQGNPESIQSRRGRSFGVCVRYLGRQSASVLPSPAAAPATQEPSASSRLLGR